MTSKHLSRLNITFNEQPLFFITTCTHQRNKVLDQTLFHEIAVEVWKSSQELYGWMVGRYVLMPDHVHFFCTPKSEETKLEVFVGKWKEWTAKYAKRRLNFSMPLWQAEFFDHVMRSSESYEEKWYYVRENPVRAGLVAESVAWPYQGELNTFRVDGI